jgi:hypothetical protein
VVGDIVDAYLDANSPLKVLTKSRKKNHHQVSVSANLVMATEKLIALKRAGKVGKADGSACHLLAEIDATLLTKLIAKKKDFRPFLREIGLDAMGGDHPVFSESLPTEHLAANLDVEEEEVLEPASI